jgi:hypothetical protein
MKLIFAGTPDFAAGAERAHAAGHEIALVLTGLDKPAGRGQKLVPSPVKRAGARACRLSVKPRTLRDPTHRHCWRDASPGGCHDRGGLRPDPAARGAGDSAATAASTSMRRCCRAGAARRRSSGRSRPATPRPASRSCRWMRVWTPARCCWPRRTADRTGRHRRAGARSARGSRRDDDRRGARSAGGRHAWCR